jgi:hypothetical protein
MTPQTPYEEALRDGDHDRIFYELVNHSTQPLTDAELEKLIALRPSVWGRYAEYVGLLDDQVEDRRLSALSGLSRQST